MADTLKTKRRWYSITSDRISVGVLAAVGLLVASEQLQHNSLFQLVERESRTLQFLPVQAEVLIWELRYFFEDAKRLLDAMGVGADQADSTGSRSFILYLQKSTDIFLCLTSAEELLLKRDVFGQKLVTQGL